VNESFTDDQRLMYYLPIEQYQPSWGNRIVVRAAGGDAAAIAERVRRTLQRAMPGQGYVTVQPLAELVDAQRRSWMLGATLFAAFGALALAVAAVGLYGVVAYDVAQRTHEMAVRVALGARERDVVRLVVGRGVALALAGVAIGVGAALAAARWVQPLLFEQPARDPLTYGVVAAVLLAVAGLASAAPALRAARTDPSEALRVE
jgi:putative ABC transport system permease protein